MKTKFIFVLMAALLIGGQSIYAQDNSAKDNKDGKQRHMRGTAIHIHRGNSKTFDGASSDKKFHFAEWMVKTLMLDDATAAKFTPIYNDYRKEMMECQKANRKGRMMKGNKDERKSKEMLTDKEIEEQIENQFAQGRKILDIREKYYKQFRKILSPRQIMKIYDSEKMLDMKYRHELNNRFDSMNRDEFKSSLKDGLEKAGEIMGN